MAMASLVAGVTEKRCAICGAEEKLRQCSRCKSKYYCSNEHQRKDWPSHKLACTAPSTAVDKSQPVGDNKGSSRTSYADTSVTNDKDSYKTKLDTETIQRSKTDDKKYDAPTERHKSVAIDFDKRPLKRTEFSKPESLELETVIPFVANQLNEKGYCVVDGLLKTEECDSVLKEVETLANSDKMNRGELDGGRTSANPHEKNQNPEIRSDKMCWLDEAERQKYPALTDYITKHLDSLVMMLTPFFDGNYVICNRSKPMVACYPGDGTAYHRHIDNPNKDGRCITCILYLNKDWVAEEDGGYLRIFPNGEDNFVDVVPHFNRILFFWSDKRNPHEVHPAFKHRYAVTVWYFDQTERDNAKAEALEAELAAAQQSLAQLEIKKRELQRKTLELELENAASKAIGSLSDQEMDAMAALISGHPDPKNALSSLGINESIQDHLIRVLKTRSAKS